MNETLFIRLGEPAKALVAKNLGTLKLDEQPAGLDFVRAKWREPQLGVIEVKQGVLGVKFDKVLTLDAMQDTGSFGSEGIVEIDVNMMLADKEKIGHDEARQRFFAFL